MPEQTQARRDHRLPLSLTDEQMSQIAEAGNVPREHWPRLRRHLEALITIEYTPVTAGIRELKKVRRLAQAALETRQDADFARLGEALAQLTPPAHESLAWHADLRRDELPEPEELTAGASRHEAQRQAIVGKIALLFGILSRLDLKPDRDRGKPPDDFRAMILSGLAYIYRDVAGRAPSLGRGARWSPFEAFLDAVLTTVGWRSADAADRPRQAREAVQAIDEARKRRLAAQLGPVRPLRKDNQ